jgi:hypothetical protein
MFGSLNLMQVITVPQEYAAYYKRLDTEDDTPEGKTTQ